MGKYDEAKKLMESVNGISDIIQKAKAYDKLVQFKSNKELRCSFCGRPQSKVKRLIAGNNVYACDDCVALMTVICEEEIEGFDKTVENYRKDVPEKIC